MGLRIAPLDLSSQYSELLLKTRGQTLYHSLEWLRFLDCSLPGKTIFLGLFDGRDPVGVLPARELKRYSVRIIASPMPGWTTPYMGPVWLEGADNGSFLSAFSRFMKDFGYYHGEVASRSEVLMPADGWKSENQVTWVAAINNNDEEILRSFSKSCQKSIKRSIREGVVTEFMDGEDFVDIYYRQLEEVFGKRDWRPTYDKQRVKNLWKTFKPTGRLLTSCAKIRNEVIATRIDIIGYDTMHSFGSASSQQHLKYYPNENLRYFSMCKAAELSIRKYDMSGGGKYKKKFNADQVDYLLHVRSPWWLMTVRGVMRKIAYLRAKKYLFVK